MQKKKFASESEISYIDKVFVKSNTKIYQQRKNQDSWASNFHASSSTWELKWEKKLNQNWNEGDGWWGWWVMERERVICHAMSTLSTNN